MKQFLTVSFLAVLALTFSIDVQAQPPTSNNIHFQNETGCAMTVIAYMATIIPGTPLNTPPDELGITLKCNFIWHTGEITVPANSFITISGPVGAIGFVGGAIAKPCENAPWAWAEVCTPDDEAKDYPNCCGGKKYGVDILASTVVISYHP